MASGPLCSCPAAALCELTAVPVSLPRPVDCCCCLAKALCRLCCCWWTCWQAAEWAGSCRAEAEFWSCRLCSWYACFSSSEAVDIFLYLLPEASRDLNLLVASKLIGLPWALEEAFGEVTILRLPLRLFGLTAFAGRRCACVILAATGSWCAGACCCCCCCCCGC